ncbi:hypothetical protein MNBD_GAMMA12-3955 [hydrothermal vent metagenome]|uniref:Uncharacterized protein n=1 Tax=hydrothermal vent metagenome TaxID=652676 RepID=A0A3B0YYQ2_9ZZZZ
MKQISIHFAVFIGLDWADQKHDFCMKCTDPESLEHGIFQHTPDAIEESALSKQKYFKD